MKNINQSKKTLSPVVASIILIAVTVAVSIAVAAWMGLTIGFMQHEAETEAPRILHFGGIIDDYIRLPDESNVTLVFVKSFPDNMPQVRFGDGEEFVESAIKHNVTYLLTNFNGTYYDSSIVPDDLPSNTMYPVRGFHYWFYSNIDGVGKVAYVYRQQVTAWYEETQP